MSLLAAVATEGYQELFDSLVRATERNESPAAKVVAVATAYLAFAERRRAHYRIMFLSDIEDRNRFPELHAASGRSLVLVIGLLQLAKPRLEMAEGVARAIAAVSACHGFASLRAAGVLSNIPGIPKVALLQREAVAQIVRGALR